MRRGGSAADVRCVRSLSHLRGGAEPNHRSDFTSYAPAPNAHPDADRDRNAFAGQRHELPPGP
jgi:hypothetical protein